MAYIVVVQAFFRIFVRKSSHGSAYYKSRQLK
jgi:hypothetical protein